jgi:hypothetical protein
MIRLYYCFSERRAVSREEEEEKKTKDFWISKI